MTVDQINKLAGAIHFGEDALSENQLEQILNTLNGMNGDELKRALIKALIRDMPLEAAQNKNTIAADIINKFRSPDNKFIETLQKAEPIEISQDIFIRNGDDR